MSKRGLTRQGAFCENFSVEGNNSQSDAVANDPNTVKRSVSFSGKEELL